MAGTYGHQSEAVAGFPRARTLSCVKRRNRALAMALGCGWLAALSVVVGIATETRSDRAGTNGSAGAAIVVMTVPVVLLAAWLLREPVAAFLTFSVAATFSCWIAWDVLHDGSSIAAVGVPGPAVIGAFVVVIGIALQGFIRRIRASNWRLTR